MTLTDTQQQILDLVIEKVRDLFDECPDKVHGFDHAERVAAHATYIAEAEGVDPFLPTLAGWLHDIGRAIEEYPDKFPQYDNSKTHHELSYEMLQQWFRDADDLHLSETDKLELLYDVRYHWNDEANQYDSAYILRDADKIDGLGEVGLMRHREHNKHTDPKKAHLDIRLRYEWICHFSTDTAKQMYKESDLIAPFEEERTNILKNAIKPVEL